MRTYRTQWFQGWAANEGLTDEALASAVREIVAALIDGDLGGHVVKKRVGLQGRGKRSGVRTLLALRREDKAFFIYGFAKNERANISQKELKALRMLAADLLSYGTQELAKAVRVAELIELEVRDDG